ncbi:PTS system mannose/fructose/sorbose family transporter subunit IID [Neobacillus sp. 19]|uniref:PTS system mannose/fructose/sorbose family transporter subunit IID n=1 Tax=Neobacillus sp. 19 TaxID=3394458 RepID=UPI003BF6ADCE
MKMNNDGKLAKKIRYKVLWRWIFTSSVSSNYQKMQALAYCYAILPFLRFIHKDHPDELQKAVKNHLQFFNTNPWIAPYVLGVNLGIEEKEKNNALETISSVKTSLMGPLAGMGDSLFVVVPWTVFGAIAANMALDGSPVGIFLWLAIGIVLKLLSFPLFEAGYKSGTALVEKLHSQLKHITSAISIVGLMVVGALIASVVRSQIAFEFKQGDVKINGQEILDQILPGLVPAAVVFLVYILLGRKVKPVWTILIVLVLSIVAYVLKILK